MDKKESLNASFFQDIGEKTVLTGKFFFNLKQIIQQESL